MSRRISEEPLLWAPLEHQLTRYFGKPRHRPGEGQCPCAGVPNITFGEGRCWSLKDASEVLGFHYNSIKRWAEEGVPAGHCDGIAVLTFGLLPYMIWGFEWEDWADRWAEEPEAIRARNRARCGERKKERRIEQRHLQAVS